MSSNRFQRVYEAARAAGLDESAAAELATDPSLDVDGRALERLDESRVSGGNDRRVQAFLDLGLSEAGAALAACLDPRNPTPAERQRIREARQRQQEARPGGAAPAAARASLEESFREMGMSPSGARLAALGRDADLDEEFDASVRRLFGAAQGR